MFIVTFTDGSKFKEADGYTWDDVPLDRPIASVEIPIPHQDNVVGLEHCHGYYCMREAVTVIAATGEPVATDAKVVAQILGGIDYDEGTVQEVRVDTEGKVSVRDMPIPQFESRFIDPATRQGSFDPAIIRPGKSTNQELED